MQPLEFDSSSLVDKFQLPLEPRIYTSNLTGQSDYKSSLMAPIVAGIQGIMFKT